VSRRRRKEKKPKRKRLERVPEKLQRKRDRQERQRTRRMPGWFRTALVVVLIAVIVGAAAWVWINLPRDIEPPPLSRGEVNILQQDMFYVYINDTGQVRIDFMVGRYAGGTFEGEQPLNLSITRSFDENQVNFTLIDPYVFYDYFGNAYHFPPDVVADGFTYRVDNIQPNMLNDIDIRSIRGGQSMRGYWSLFWDYILNSSENLWLQTDTMSDMYNFTFNIQPENDTIPYNIPWIVHCNITFNTLEAQNSNVYNFGESMILFPKQIYNDTELLANITVHDVYRIGRSTIPTLTPNIDNETHVGFEAQLSTALFQNETWGFEFDLNVTTFTNETFTLLDFTTPDNEFFLQSGFAPTVDEQRMHFPKADIDILTDNSGNTKQNVTDIFIRLPGVFADNGTIYYHVSPDSFGPRIFPVSLPVQEPCGNQIQVFVGNINDSIDLTLQTIPLFIELRRFLLFK
jgi:hypothetical protein